MTHAHAYAQTAVPDTHPAPRAPRRARPRRVCVQWSWPAAAERGPRPIRGRSRTARKRPSDYECGRGRTTCVYTERSSAPAGTLATISARESYQPMARRRVALRMLLAPAAAADEATASARTSRSAQRGTAAVATRDAPAPAALAGCATTSATLDRRGAHTLAVLTSVLAQLVPAVAVPAAVRWATANVTHMAASRARERRPRARPSALALPPLRRRVHVLPGS